MQAGRPQSLSSLQRCMTLSKYKTIPLPLNAACNHKELINPKLAHYSSGTCMKCPPSLKFIHHCSLKQTFMWQPNQFSSFPKHWVNCTGFRKKPFFILELATIMAACWLQKPSQDTGDLSAVWCSHPSLTHFCPFPSNRCNCSFTPARTSDEQNSDPESTVFQMICY